MTENETCLRQVRMSPVVTRDYRTDSVPITDLPSFDFDFLRNWNGIRGRCELHGNETDQFALVFITLINRRVYPSEEYKAVAALSIVV
jgi:hypothetical protein